MQAKDCPFIRIINGNTQFLIPVFQRDYSWTEVQCEQLFRDVLRVGREADGRAHFIGSVVYVPAGDTSAGFTRWLLIDGQQRMTSLMLLALALRKHMKAIAWEPADDECPTPEQIEAYLLKNTLERGDRRHKLVLRNTDHEVLKALMDDHEPSHRNSKVFENFEFFLERVREEDPMVVYRGMSRLVVVDVTLQPPHDDPQMIFESLNSTGLDLTQSDLIRNFILMRRPEAEQTRLYEQYWFPIENLFRGAERQFDAFARDYLALAKGANRQVRTDQIYYEFRSFLEQREREGDIDELLAHILRFAQHHAAFSVGRGADGPVQPALSRLNRLAEVAATLVVRLSDCRAPRGNLSEGQFLEALALLESYVFRRTVCGMQTRGYWETFANLAQRVRDEDPLLSLKVSLARLRDSARFPRDDEFLRELLTRDLYSLRTCHYLLDRLENHGSLEPTDTSRYSVEHVLPQNDNLSAEWRQMLGEGWKEVQQVWLHRLGNLTLTAYNSRYSDKPFVEKKTIPGGFADSSVRLNRSIREQEQWTAAEIEVRGQALAQRALAIWPALKVPEEALKEAELRHLRSLSERRDVDKVQMSAAARRLFNDLRPRVLDLDGDVIEVAETQSICYHDGDRFLEVVPRKYCLALLLNLDHSEARELGVPVIDATTYLYHRNARYAAGSLFHVNSAADLDNAMRLVREAHQLAKA